MSQTAMTFQRIEQKYRVTAQQRDEVLAALAGRMELDAYGATLVRSLYYDTPTNDLVSRSIEQPLYKEKLRVRRYGTLVPEARCVPAGDAPSGSAAAGNIPADLTFGEAGEGELVELGGMVFFAPGAHGRVFVEMKKKYKGIGYKRRVEMSAAAAAAFLEGMPYSESCGRWPLADSALQEESLQPASLQKAREIAAMLARYPGLRPSLEVRCVRRAYYPVESEAEARANELRVTIDEHLRFVDMQPCAADGESRDRGQAPVTCARPIIPEGECILEIKALHAAPRWLATALSDAGVYKTSFSKYATAHRHAFGA